MLLLITFFTSSERGADGKLIEEPVIRTADTFRFLKSNKALWILFAGVTIGSLGHAIANGAIVYYVVDYAGQPDAIAGIFTATLIAAAVSIPVWVTSMRWLSKRQVWMIASLGSMTVMALLYLLAPRDVMTILSLQSVGGSPVRRFCRDVLVDAAGHGRIWPMEERRAR